MQNPPIQPPSAQYQDRSLYYDDIRGARSKFLHPSLNRQFPYQEAYSNSQPQYGRNLYQHQMLAIPEQIAPQGIQYFQPTGKKHFPDQQRGEIETYHGMQHLFDPPKKFMNDYDRSLNTKDIDGAVTNTLRSKVVKNMELAQVYNKERQDKQQSLWEPNRTQNEYEYQPRKKWEFENKSAIYSQPEQQKQVPQLENFEKAQSQNNADKRILSQEYRQLANEKEIQQQQQQQYQQQQEYYYPQSQSLQMQTSTSQPVLKGIYQSSPYQQKQIQDQQQQNVQEQQQQQLQQYQNQKFIENDKEREKQQQLFMQKQWEQQKQENIQRVQQYQQEKILEQQQNKQREQQDQQFISEYQQLNNQKKQQYAQELQQQQDFIQNANQRKGFTPPPIQKSEMINQILHTSTKQQKSQGFDEEQNNNQRDSLTKEVEELDKKMVINRFRPHELQQYIYDLKNGRIGGPRSRNNPTFMSYAGQQLVNK